MLRRFAGGRRADALFVCILIILPCLLFADVLLLGNGFFVRDLALYHYPMKAVVRDALLSGEFPYWNPFFSAGEPLAANPAYELFYPPQWLVLLPDFHFGFQLHVLFHLFVVLSGCYRLLRSLRLSAGASIFGSISFGLAGPALSLVNILPTLFAFAWVPWILLYTRRFLIRPSRRNLAFASLFLGLHFLVGEPASTLQVLILSGCYATWRVSRLSRNHWQGFLRTFARLSIILICGAAVSAIQLVPAIDFFRDTIRASGFDSEISGLWSMPPERPVELLFPAAFGSIEDYGTGYWARRLYPRFALPYLFSIYLGLAAAVLVMAGIVRRARGALLSITLLLVSYLLAIGTHAPLFDTLYEAGLFRSLRYPERFALMGTFVLMMFAATLFQRVLLRDRQVLRVALVVSCLVGAIAFVVWITTHVGGYETAFREKWALRSTPMTATLAALNRREWLLAGARPGFLALLLLWRLRRTDRIWGLAFALFVLVDLAPLSLRILPRAPRHFFSAPDIVAQLPANKHQYRIFHLAEWLTDSEEGKRYFQTGTGLFWILRNGMFPYTGARWGFRTVLERGTDGTMLSTTDSLIATIPEASRLRPGDWVDRYAALSNVRFHTLLRPAENAVRRARGEVEEINPVVFVGRGSYPRFSFAERLVSIRSQRDFTTGLMSDRFIPGTAFVFFPAFQPAPGRIREARESANEIRLRVTSSGRSYLVSSVSFHRYWRAFVDGRRVPLHRTNLAYQGLVIPPGSHQVKLRYRNPLVFPSAIVSVIAIVAIAWALISRKRDVRILPP